VSASLKSRILEDVKSAMRARDKQRLGALRQVTAAIKQREVDTRTELDDAALLGVLEKMVKQRRESLEHYEKAGRRDLADQESFEIELIRAYMPQPLDEAGIEREVEAAIAEAGAASMRDMGKVMALLKARVQGRADMAAVSARVKDRLSGGG